MDQEKIGVFISTLRKEQGMTQQQLADAIGVSNKTISKWECGKGMPELALIVPLCHILQISINEFLSGEHLLENGYTEKAEVNMIKSCFFVVYQYRRYNLLHVGNFAACRYNYCSRRNYFFAVRILLRHRQRIFSGRNVDLQGAAEVAQCLYCRIKTCVLTLLRAARPHPVG